MTDISIKLLSWNLHGLAWPLSHDPGGRMDRVAAKIRELSPAVALLQEVWTGSNVERLTRALQPDWIPICIRHRGGSPTGGLLAFVSAVAGWRARTAPEYHPFTASAPAWKIWEGDGFAGKGVLSVELERGDRRIRVVNAHLQAEYTGTNYTEVRRAQLIQLREVVSHFDAATPAIVAGDLNTDSAETLYSLIAALGTDLTTEARALPNRGTTANPRGGRPEWIDYIVAANSDAWTVSTILELIENERADVPYSDHSGLFCTLTLTSRRA
jgi:endonuclease/exonuclease/phosphatase family metal-dependent hydrolase